MRETPADLAALQGLLDRSVERAGAHLRRSFDLPDRALTAAGLAERLEGWLTAALATVTAGGEPRVAPVGALFVRGRFHVPTVAESARARHLARRPAASLTCYEGSDFAVIAHGRVTILGPDDAAFAPLDELQVACGKPSVRGWGGQPVYLRLDATSLLTFARDPAGTRSAP